MSSSCVSTWISWWIFVFPFVSIDVLPISLYFGDSFHLNESTHQCSMDALVVNVFRFSTAFNNLLSSSHRVNVDKINAHSTALCGAINRILLLEAKVKTKKRLKKKGHLARVKCSFHGYKHCTKLLVTHHAHLMQHISDLMWKANNWTKGNFFILISFSFHTQCFSTIFSTICFLVTHLSSQELGASCALCNTFHGWEFKLNALTRDESSFFFFLLLLFFCSLLLTLTNSSTDSSFYFSFSFSLSSGVMCEREAPVKVTRDEDGKGSRFKRRPSRKSERKKNKDSGKWLAYSSGNAKYKLLVWVRVHSAIFSCLKSLSLSFSLSPYRWPWLWHAMYFRFILSMTLCVFFLLLLLQYAPATLMRFSYFSCIRVSV